MSNVVYKVGNPGEGKTRWLIERARDECERGEYVVLLTQSRVEYQKFVEYYYAIFHEVCKVSAVSHIHEIPEFSVVLIDDLLSIDMHVNAINFLYNHIKKAYVTLEGNCADTLSCTEHCSNQMSIFD